MTLVFSLAHFQSLLHARIRERAVELGYDPAKVEPVYDGVVDWEGYLAAPVKVRWILKESFFHINEHRNSHERRI